MDEAELRKRITQIQLDHSLSDAEKAKKRQELLSGRWSQPAAKEEGEAATDDKGKEAADDTTIFDETLKCAMCMDLCARPVTAPCQHNFCLGCFNKWVAQGKKTCPTCRHAFPAKFAANPRINTLLASAIRMAKLGQRPINTKVVVHINDKDRPDEAFTTDRAVRSGRANAASGRIMVTVPGDHFGPIPPEADPRGMGVRVGEFWKDRLDCRQWGAHFPHVAGIAGQSGQGAQSVVLSGGYEDDLDEGEWFLYTGSGGRDLSGNKRVNKIQSFDQTFDKMNKALLISCEKGLPVRVVRSHKEKRSAYAPSEEQPVRYDGIYRIARAYRKPGAQQQLVCRYVFIRCDNEPAPWSSEDTGDVPWMGELPAAVQKEMKEAKGKVYEMCAKPWWDYDAEKKQWGWARPAPVSQKLGGDPSSSPKKARRKANEHERALREFTCTLCKGILNQPLSTPCGHHFCKPCLLSKFKGQGDIEDRATNAGRALRERKVVKPCPTCKADIAEFLQHGQVNRGMVEVIAKLQDAARAAEEAAARLEAGEGAHEEDGAGEEAGEEVLAEEDQMEADADDSAPAQAVADPEPSATTEAPAEPAAAGSNEEQEASAAVVAAPPVPPTANGNTCAAQSAEEMAALVADFPEYDKELLKGMVEDQGGDFLETRAVLRRMRNQLAAAERKAKKAATAAEAGPSGAPAGRAKKGGSGKKTAAAKLEAEGDDEAGPSGAAPQLPSSKAEQDGAPLDADAANGNATAMDISKQKKGKDRKRAAPEGAEPAAKRTNPPRHAQE
ncbi:g205 [Coccomyxa elongata]